MLKGISVAAVLLAIVGCTGGGGGRVNPLPSPPVSNAIGGGSDFFTALNQPVVGWYHVNASTIKQDLATMRANGQRKIALPIFFTSIPRGKSSDPNVPDVWYHNVNSAGGALSAQQQQNLKDFCAAIDQAGFSEFLVRFGPQGVSSPKDWGAWNQTMFDENEAFVFGVRSVIESCSMKARRVYDLALELAGRTDTPLAQRYCTQMWKDYVAANGSGDSCAFGAPAVPEFVGNLIDWLKAASLPLPAVYSLDCYPDVAKKMTRLRDTLAKRGEAGKPVILGETYYNDAQTANEIRQTKALLRLQSFYQWPVKRSSGQPTPANFEGATVLFNNYTGI
jgi:hypothetical protein